MVQEPAALTARRVSVTVTAPRVSVALIGNSGEMSEVKTAVPGTEIAKPPAYGLMTKVRLVSSGPAFAEDGMTARIKVI